MSECYISLLDNYDKEQIEILSTTSSEESLPLLSRPKKRSEVRHSVNVESSTDTEDTIPLSIDVTFHYQNSIFMETFPNNSKGSVSIVVYVVFTRLYGELNRPC